jgi:hypothetical protein
MPYLPTAARSMTDRARLCSRVRQSMTTGSAQRETNEKGPSKRSGLLSYLWNSRRASAHRLLSQHSL